LRLAGLGERSSSPSGSGPSPAAKWFLVHFRAENASGHNHCLDEFLGENPLIPYRTRGDMPSEELDEIWCQYTRMMGLSCGKEIVRSRLSRTHEGDVSTLTLFNAKYKNISQMAKKYGHIVAIECE